MAEVGVSVAAKIAEYLVDPTLRQLQYLFCVGKITRNVEIKKEELILKQGRVQECVQEAINRTERIDGEVNKWKSDVKSLIAEVENLEEVLKVNNGCLRGWLPTWRRYCLCKKLAKTTKRMIDLNTKSDYFNPFSHLVVIQDIEYHSSQNFKLFNATRMAFDQLLEALKDNGSFMIGLWGMGGSGKTTLVKEVGKKSKESKLFDRVVLTAISQSPDIRKIQGEIADTLGIKLEEESEIGRAKRIALRLQSGERILIILDDVWAKLNLEDIGIPSGGNYQRSCKVVLTTRRLKVCTSMDCQKRIQLDLLKEDEAWTLFQTYANVDDDAKDVAQAIAMECKGLPIAIVALGTCLKRKGVEEMNGMLSKLRNVKLNNMVDEDVRDAFACLELSYDYLATPEAKLLLLLCAMFPEDHNIYVEDLFAYGVGLGLCGNVESFETARREVRTTINYLIDSSLLMDNSNKSNVHAQNNVKLHDVVRDVALWIASKEHRTIMVNCTEKIVDEAVNDCYAFSLWNNNNRLLQFLSQFHAPKLEFLLLSSSELLDTSHAIFEGTEGLKALIIMCTNWWRPKIELQPQSIQHLSNLRTLRLQNWNLRDICFVVSLTRLEILDLQGSEFARVPDGIEKLSKLKLLDLSRCRIDECCYKVIGRCSQLEELYVSNHFSHSRNQNCYEYLGGFTANLLKFRRYNLEIGELYRGDSLFRNQGTRSLSLGQLNISYLGAVFKDLARRATIIEFYELEGGSKSFMADIVQAVGGLNELTKLCLRSCLEIEYIIDETTTHEDAIVPKLDELVLEDMHILRQLWCGPSPFSLFQKLKKLNIVNCPHLLNIFPIANCNLGNLKSLTISRCPMLTSLFPVSAACTLLSLIELQIDHSPQMKFVFDENASEEQLMYDQYESQIDLRLLEYLKLHDLPNLVGICSGRYCPRWPSIKAIYWTNCPNMKLQQLECHQLGNEEYKSLALIERIKLSKCGVESIFHYQIGLKEQIPAFQCLTELTLEECARLKFVFSAHICQNLPELTSVTISRCEELEAIFLGNEETPINLCITESCMLKLKSLRISKCNKLKFVLSFMVGAATSMLPQLSTLTVSDCSQMEEIFKCSNIEEIPAFQCLKELTLEGCAKLKFVFSAHICQNLRELTSVTISRCEELEAVFFGNEETPINLCITESCMLKLKSLRISECNKLKFVLSFMIGAATSMLPQLSTLTVSDCSQMEEIFKCSNIEEIPAFQCLCITESCMLKLESLEISKCNKLKFVLSFMIGTATSMLPQLSTLTVSDCSQMEEIFKCSNIEDHDTDSEREIKFQNMRHMTLNNLPMLVNICQGFKMNIGRFKLRTGDFCEVMVDGCPKLMPIRSAIARCTEEGLVREYELKYSQLNNREALNLPLSVLNVGELDIQSPRVEDHCWQIIGDDDQEETDDSEILRSEQQLVGGVIPTQFLSFQYLHSLSVTDNKKLKFLFSMSTIVHNSLPKLKSLTLSDCEELEVIFGHSGDEDANYGDTIVLSSLKMIELKNLPNFKSVCLVGLEIQVELTNIDIGNCPKFVDSSLGSALQQLGTLSVSIEDLNVETSSNVNEEKGTMLISRAEHLWLEDSTNLIFVWEGPTFIKFQNLVLLHVIKCRRLKCIFPSTVMRSLPCLDDLWIDECEELEEIMSSGEEEHNHFPNESSNNSLCFPQLRYLTVSRCRKLKWLFPSPPSTLLPRLILLKIEGCSELKGLCNSEVEIHEEGFYNNSLPKLESLTVEDCPMFSETTLAALQRYSCQRRNRLCWWK